MVMGGGGALFSFCLLATRTVTTRLLYEHGYHAGNYADVVKHSVLIQLLHHMSKKSKPFSYVETHSGAGLYRLSPQQGESSSSLREYEQGIHQLFQKETPTSSSSILLDDETNTNTNTNPLLDLPLPTQTLLELMKQLRGIREQSSEEGGESYSCYPGSPWIAKSLCRTQDSLLFCENQPEQLQMLKENLLLETHNKRREEEDPTADTAAADTSNNNIRFLCANGYKALKQRENMEPSQRALIFMDPPYQLGSDTEQICGLVSHLQKYWSSARVAIWHPVSARTTKQSTKLYELIKSSVDPGTEILAIEMYSPSSDEHTNTTTTNSGTDDRYMVGTGMVMVNPPYGIDKELQDMLPQLDRYLSPSSAAKSTISIKFL
jgi:23S rRNA (adenine2030-N6)-methyltransferase